MVVRIGKRELQLMHPNDWGILIMKKYTKEHLENIDPCWIDAVERLIEKVPNRCPTGQANLITKRWQYSSGISFLVCYVCQTYFKYHSTACPCSYFGSCENAIAEALNLIRQWKKWAGIGENDA
jgi:hypothetical protein